MDIASCSECGCLWPQDDGLECPVCNPRMPTEDELAEYRVCLWLYQCGGDLPSDEDFERAICHIARQWRREKSEGLDIVATAHRDHLEKLVKAMKDLI